MNENTAEARCLTCGKPATCYGAYEGNPTPSYACDTCCAHGCEDGWCKPLNEGEGAAPAPAVEPVAGEREEAAEWMEGNARLYGRTANEKDERGRPDARFLRFARFYDMAAAALRAAPYAEQVLADAETERDQQAAHAAELAARVRALEEENRGLRALLARLGVDEEWLRRLGLAGERPAEDVDLTIWLAVADDGGGWVLGWEGPRLVGPHEHSWTFAQVFAEEVENQGRYTEDIGLVHPDNPPGVHLWTGTLRWVGYGEDAEPEFSGTCTLLYPLPALSASPTPVADLTDPELTQAEKAWCAGLRDYTAAEYTRMRAARDGRGA